MGTLYKKDERLKTQDDTSSTTKKAWWRKPSQKVTFKSETVVSTNTTTSDATSTLDWIERTEENGIVQTTPMTNNTRPATLQTSQTASMSMPTTRPAARVQWLASKSQLTTEETSTQKTSHTVKHKSTKAGYLTTEDYSDILETAKKNNEKADRKGEVTTSDISVQQYTEALELSHTAPELYLGTKLVYQETPLTEDDHKTDMVEGRPPQSAVSKRFSLRHI
jgi:hypothetical protein